jgi:hypothetical protein
MAQARRNVHPRAGQIDFWSRPQTAKQRSRLHRKPGIAPIGNSRAVVFKGNMLSREDIHRPVRLNRNCLTHIYFHSMFFRLAEMCGCLLAKSSGCVGGEGNVEIVFFSKRTSGQEKAIFV